MKFYKNLGKLSIKSKIVLLAMLSTLIPLLIVGTFSFIYLNRVIENKISETTTNLLSLIDWNINTFVSDIESNSEIIYSSNDTQDYLNQMGVTKETYKTKVETRDLLINITSNNTYINAVYLGNENNEYLQLSQGQITYYGNIYQHIKKTVWFKDIMQRTLYGTWLKSEIDFIESENLLVYGRAVKDFQTLEVIGTLLISVDKAIFEDMFKDIKQDGEILIIDAKGNILYSKENTEVKYEAIVDRLSPLQSNASEIVTINKDKYILNINTNEETKWKIISIIPYSSIVKEFDYVRTISVILLALSFFIATICSFLISNKITKQLSLLRDMIKKMKRRDVLKDISFDTSDEVGKIGDQFIALYNRNNELTVQLYETQLKEKEAELLALQNHINPHFLYNTLNSIFWMAEKAKAKSIAKMAIHLAKIFKLTLNNGEFITTVGNEIEQVKSYLDIQNIRYDNRINYQINVDPSLFQEQLIKLLLQPLVENAVYHGLEMKNGPWEITINGRMDSNSLLFEVIDNGVGFDSENTQKNKQGYALKNINERIHLQYGSGYGLTIKSELDKGTIVTLRIGTKITPLSKMAT